MSKGKLWNVGNDANYSNEEYTPRDVWEPIGPFEGDPCAGVGTCIGTEFNWTKQDNGLWIPWPKDKTLFVNPPFADPEKRTRYEVWKREIIDKCHDHGNCILLISIGATAAWQMYLYSKADAWFAFANRIRFGGHKKDAKFSTYLFAFGRGMVDRLRNSGHRGVLMGRI